MGACGGFRLVSQDLDASLHDLADDITRVQATCEPLE
jgi:hypothetical protein